MPREIDQIGTELNDLTASIGVFFQIIQIASPVHFAHLEMAAVLLDQRIQQRHRFFIARKAGWEIVVVNCHCSDFELAVRRNFGIVDGNQRF